MAYPSSPPFDEAADAARVRRSRRTLTVAPAPSPGARCRIRRWLSENPGRARWIASKAGFRTWPCHPAAKDRWGAQSPLHAAWRPRQRAWTAISTTALSDSLVDKQQRRHLGPHVRDHWSMAAEHGTRPTVDSEVDDLLRENLSPVDHRSWWDAEHALLGGITACEALAAGERPAVVAAARVRPGASFLSPVCAAEIQRGLHRRENPPA